MPPPPQKKKKQRKIKTINEALAAFHGSINLHARPLLITPLLLLHQTQVVANTLSSRPPCNRPLFLLSLSAHANRGGEATTMMIMNDRKNAEII